MGVVLYMLTDVMLASDVIYALACKEGIFVAVIWSRGHTGTGGQGRVKGGTTTVAPCSARNTNPTKLFYQVHQPGSDSDFNPTR